jgi:ribonuclease E
LRNDRARIQVGRISHFGLLEMSRQRLRTGMLEGSTSSCAMCQGTGIVRSVESAALDVLRSLEDRLLTDGIVPLVATTSIDVALYILNQKRLHLRDIEQRYQVSIQVTADEELHVSQFLIERATETELLDVGAQVVQMDASHPSAPEPSAEAESDDGPRRSRRRRRKRRGPDEEEEQETGEPLAASTQKDAKDAKEVKKAKKAEQAPGEASAEKAGAADGNGGARKPRRRGRRGGRRRTRPDRAGTEMAASAEAGDKASGDADSHADQDAGRPEASRNRHKVDLEPAPKAGKGGPHAEAKPVLAEIAVAREAVEERPEITVASEAVEERPEIEAEEETGPPRRGWWQR